MGEKDANRLIGDEAGESSSTAVRAREEETTTALSRTPAECEDPAGEFESELVSSASSGGRFETVPGAGSDGVG